MVTLFLGVSIAHIVMNDKGIIERIYDKAHLCQFGDCSEKIYFSFNHNNKILTEQDYCVFQVDGFTIGLTICYDLRFPELWRELSLNLHVDVILHPNGWSKVKKIK